MKYFYQDAVAPVKKEKKGKSIISRSAVSTFPSFFVIRRPGSFFTTKTFFVFFISGGATKKYRDTVDLYELNFLVFSLGC